MIKVIVLSDTIRFKINISKGLKLAYKMRKSFFSLDNNIYEIKTGSEIFGRNHKLLSGRTDHSISKNHFLVVHYGDITEIIDLGSTNGTFINGTQLEQFTSHPLNNNDDIRVGNSTFKYIMQEPSLDFSSIFPQEDLRETPILGEKTSGSNKTLFAKINPSLDESIVFDPSRTDLEFLTNVNKRLSFLYEFGYSIGNIFDIDELMDKVMQEIFHILPVDRGLVFLAMGGNMQPSTFWDKTGKKDAKEVEYSKTLIEQVANERKSILTSDFTKDERFISSESIIALHLKSTIVVPILRGDELYGIIQLDSTTKGGQLTEDDLKIITLIANQAAINIKNSHLIDEIKEQIRIRNSLGRYLGPSLTEHIIQNKINLEFSGEERHVTILFSDIRGFSTIVEQHKATEIIDVLNLYYTKMTDIIFKNQGFIDKVIGDALLCVFGIPISLENHADLAMKSAIEMLDTLTELNKECFAPINVNIQIGIGINTGKVVHGNIGSQDRPEVTVLGDAVNISQRLSDVAAPNQILLTEQTIKELNNKYNLHKVGLLSLKGKTEKVLVYTVGSEKPIPENL